MWAVTLLAILPLPCFSSGNNATGSARLMHMDASAATPAAPSEPQVSWIVFDFGRQVTLDGFYLYSHGDSIHDVSDHFFQPATPGSSTNPTAITWAAVVGTFTGAAGVGATVPQEYAFPAAAARVWRWVVTGVHPSANCPGRYGGECQPNVAELAFHEAGNKPGVMMLNTGTANRSVVLTAVNFTANAGGVTPANPAWKAVDGKLLYADYAEGWDANVAPASTLPSPPPVPALPTATAQQLHHLENELSMFIHFSVCTFNDGCAGGQQNDAYQGWHPWPASTFNPTNIDTEQWARTALGLGARQVCLTAHHSGGFALWPTKASNYSVLASPFGKTGRDILKEFVTSMRKHEIEPCFYIILPWDAAEWHDSEQQYIDVQMTMLTELLTDYGPIARLWWDDYGLSRAAPDSPPAPGQSSGGFPAAFTNFTEHVRSLQSQTVILPGPDGCEVGAEGGVAPYPVFNFNQGPTKYPPIACQSMITPPVATAGTVFAPHEVDHTVLNPGDMWWWVEGHAWLSAAELFDHYLASIGRGSTYILNMPPNTTGLIPEYLTNETDLLGAAVNRSFSPASALARLTNLTVHCGPTAAPIELPSPAGGFAFDAVVLEEDMRRANQRIAGYTLQTCAKTGGKCSDGEWTTITRNGGGTQTFALGVTVGRKVIERGFNGTDALTIYATGLRFRCTAAFPAGTTTAYLKSFSAHKMQPPPCWPKTPPKPFNCSAFEPPCTCKGMADYYGVAERLGGMGCAPQDAIDWWIKNKVPCARSPMKDSCCQVADYTTKNRPFPGCCGQVFE